MLINTYQQIQRIEIKGETQPLELFRRGLPRELVPQNRDWKLQLCRVLARQLDSRANEIERDVSDIDK